MWGRGVPRGPVLPISALLLTNALRLWREKLSMNQRPATPSRCSERALRCRFKLEALVSSGGKAGAAAWGTLDFSTGHRWLGVEPEWQAGECSLCPAGRPLEVVGAGPVYVRLRSFSLCVSWPPAPSTPQSRGTGGGCPSAVGPSH